MSKSKKGWGFLLKAKKAHYFDDHSISMCGKWMFVGELFDDKHWHPDNCKICAIKRFKKYAKEKPKK